MPTVLITGINGFVAVHTALVYLENGWNVRGTARSHGKGVKALALPCFQRYQSNLTYVVVEDLVSGNLKPALEGVNAVVHCASPCHFDGKTWAEYRDPAVRGTTNVLEQAADVESIAHCVIISSFGAMVDPFVPYTEQRGRVFTEDDWLPQTEEDCENAEKADQYVMHHPTREILGASPTRDSRLRNAEADLCQIHIGCRQPAEYVRALAGKTVARLADVSVVFGPSVHLSSAGKIQEADYSTSVLFASMAAGRNAPIPPAGFPAWVDVRNVAFALYTVVANGRNGRFAIYDGGFDYELLAKEARRYRPDLDSFIPYVSDDKETPSERGTYSIDTSRAERELGYQSQSHEFRLVVCEIVLGVDVRTERSREDLITDTLAQFEALGCFAAST